MKRLLLVSPTQIDSVVSFSGARDILGCPVLMPNPALPTLAALVPDDMQVRILDESIEPIDFDAHWDFVGVTGYVDHRARIFEIADAFRRRGVLVGIGGPFASLSPHAVRDHADVVFVGEAEEIWPEFLDDLRRGAWRSEYRAGGAVDLRRSPIPAWDRMDGGAYLFGALQSSRGCPFRCEFCDAIVYLGRNQRYKTPERVVAELEALYRSGFRGAFVSDDNFTAHRRKARAILDAIGAWSRSKPDRMFLATQASIDAAREPALLDACREAGLVWLFVGVESPNPDALREAGKSQNVRADLVRDVHAFYEHGLCVQAGMVLGFDHDGPEAFRASYDYLQASGIPTTSLSILNAPDGTPLQARLRREGRLKHALTGDKYAGTNVVPLLLTEEELLVGTGWLVNRLYRPEAFLERVAVVARKMPERAPPAGREYDWWARIFDSYARLGPGFARVPHEVRALLAGRSNMVAQGVLAAYKHLVTVAGAMGVWSPPLAELEDPPLPPRSREDEARFAARARELAAGRGRVRLPLG